MTKLEGVFFTLFLVAGVALIWATGTSLATYLCWAAMLSICLPGIVRWQRRKSANHA